MTGSPRDPLDPATAARLSGLAIEHDLSSRQQEAFADILRLLASDPLAPTTITAPRDAVDVHIADSLSGLSLAEIRGARTLVDIGSGAGFPGLPLAIALPDASVSLLESNGRKCAFLERSVAQAGPANAAVVCARAEDWTAGHDRQDVVTARALAPLGVLCEYSAPLLRLGGVLVAWKAQVAPAERLAAGGAAAALGLEEVFIEKVCPYPGASEHRLHVYRKVAQTPSRFPRRAGVARKRPLGGGKSA